MQQGETSGLLLCPRQHLCKIHHEETPIRKSGQRIEFYQAILISLGGERVSHTESQLARVHGLVEDVGGAELQSFQLGFGVGGRRDDDRRNMP